MSDRNIPSNENLARLRTRFDDREKPFTRAHSEALFNEATALSRDLETVQRQLDIRNEQIDGYERQLGIINESASRTIGSEIERLMNEVADLKARLSMPPPVETSEDVQRSIDRNTAYEADLNELRTALEAIAAMENMTLLGGGDLEPERAHQLGAVKAFNQAATIAKAVLDGSGVKTSLTRSIPVPDETLDRRKP